MVLHNYCFVFFVFFLKGRVRYSKAIYLTCSSCSNGTGNFVSGLGRYDGGWVWVCIILICGSDMSVLFFTSHTCSVAAAMAKKESFHLFLLQFHSDSLNRLRQYFLCSFSSIFTSKWHRNNSNMSLQILQLKANKK